MYFIVIYFLDAVTTTSSSITVDHSDVSSSQNLTLYPSYSSVITTQPQGAFIITQPQTNSAIALAGTSITTDGLIVHTLPFNQVRACVCLCVSVIIQMF